MLVALVLILQYIKSDRLITGMLLLKSPENIVIPGI